MLKLIVLSFYCIGLILGETISKEDCNVAEQQALENFSKAMFDLEKRILGVVSKETYQTAIQQYKKKVKKSPKCPDVELPECALTIILKCDRYNISVKRTPVFTDPDLEYQECVNKVNSLKDELVFLSNNINAIDNCDFHKAIDRAYGSVCEKV